MWFKCKHPADWLAVVKEHSTKTVDADFVQITYHLFCRKCNVDVNITHSKIRWGVDSFLSTTPGGE